LNRGADAAGEFKKILDHRELTMNYPLASLARLGLARAYRLQIASPGGRGMTLKTASPSINFIDLSRREYSRVLEVWKDREQAEDPQRKSVQELSSIIH
jgi:hypothetical protein